MKKIIGALAALAFVATAVPAFADDAPAAAPAAAPAPAAKPVKKHHMAKKATAKKAEKSEKGADTAAAPK